MPFRFPLQTRLLPLAFIAGALVTTGLSAEPSPAQTERAGKIAASLEPGDDAKQSRVRLAIAGFYADLDQLQSEAGTEDKQVELRNAFFTKLQDELTAEQLERVKNGLTYDVLPITWKVYQEMLPHLTDLQKEKILGWLTEARDLAIAAGSAEKKHKCFGKYKGRITNYLSTEGIDMKQAERDMFARRKQAAEGN